MKKTGMVLTVLTSLLCGLPGLILACFGLIGLIGKASSGTTGQTPDNFGATLIGGALFIGGGIILMLIPIVVGILSRQKKGGPVQATPVYQAAPVQPVYQPAPAQPAYAPLPVQYAQPAQNPSQDLYTRLMSINRPTAPFRIVDGRAEGVDLIAEWKIVDAQWYEIFAKASLTKVFRIYLKFDPARREVRAQDHEYSVSWRAGIPSLSLAASSFKGQKVGVSFGIGTGFTENAGPGIVYKYKFNTNEIKQPIQQVIAACGWTYKGVSFGKL